MNFVSQNDFTFTLTDSPGDSSIVILEVFNAQSSESIGTLTIEKSKTQALTNSLEYVFRSLFSVLENNQTHTTKLNNKTDGSILFRDKA